MKFNLQQQQQMPAQQLVLPPPKPPPLVHYTPTSQMPAIQVATISIPMMEQHQQIPTDDVPLTTATTPGFMLTTLPASIPSSSSSTTATATTSTVPPPTIFCKRWLQQHQKQ